MHIASHFCVAKVLGDFQQISMLQLTGPIHFAVVGSPSRLSFPKCKGFPNGGLPKLVRYPTNQNSVEGVLYNQP